MRRPRTARAGGLKLRGKEIAIGFPNLSYDEVMEAWDINRTRDDETPDCA